MATAVNNFGDTRSGGLAGPMGLFIIVLMAIAVILLIRNMNKRVRRLPDSFPDPEDARREDEIAKLDAGLNRPDAGSPQPRTDASRSRASGGEADTEVSDVDATDRPSTTDPGKGRD